jgi:hypothetical protein
MSDALGSLVNTLGQSSRISLLCRPAIAFLQRLLASAASGCVAAAASAAILSGPRWEGCSAIAGCAGSGGVSAFVGMAAGVAPLFARTGGVGAAGAGTAAGGISACAAGVGSGCAATGRFKTGSAATAAVSLEGTVTAAAMAAGMAFPCVGVGTIGAGSVATAAGAGGETAVAACVGEAAAEMPDAEARAAARELLRHSATHARIATQVLTTATPDRV